MKSILKLTFIFALITATFAVFSFSSSAKEPVSGYGVWADEQAYLDSPDSPLIVSTGKELSTAIGSNKFVLCYGDVTLKSGITVANNSELIIDLNGHTLEATSSITVGSNSGYTPSSFTFRNGTVIHMSGQFMKPQPNSRVYFEGITLIERASSLFYADGVRLIHFKDSKLIFESGDKNGNSIQIYPLLETYIPKIAAYEGVGADGYKFEHTVVFENTQVIDDNFGAAMILIPARSDCVPHYSVTFMNGGGFNVIDESFILNKNSYDGMYVNLNVIKGAAFSSPAVPIEDGLDSTVELSYYNYAKLEGTKLTVSEKTSLMADGEIQPEGEIPKLIFGASANDETPYRLCNYLCDVTWVVNGVSTTVIGYADGLTLANKQDSKGYYFKTDDNGNNRVYLDVHAGWSVSENDEEIFELVTITEKESTFYARFTDVGPAALVGFESSDMSVISGAFISNVLTEDAFTEIGGGYLYLYEDATIDISNSIEIASSVTLDLGGHTLSRFESAESSSNIFKVTEGTLTVKNGCINAAMIGIAEVSDGAELVIENTELLFGTSPAFTTVDGSIYLSDSSLNSRADSPDVPAFLLSYGGGDSSVKLDGVKIDVCGPLFSHSSNGAIAKAEIEMLNCSDIKVGSVFGVHSSSTAISEDTRVSIVTSGCDIICSSVFDIPTRQDGSPYIDLTAYIKDGSFSEDPRSGAVTLITDEGKNIVGTGTGYTVTESGFTMKYSMSLETGFMARFLIPTSSSFISVISFAGETARDELSVKEVGGEEYYIYELGGISSADALDILKIKIRFENASGEYLADLSYSPIKYFETLLLGDDVLGARLSAAAIRYIRSAYEYSSSSVPEELETLMASEKYQSAIRDMSEVIVRDSALSRGNISEVFTGAQLYLSSSISVRFNLREGYNGNISVAGREYAIAGGKVGDIPYLSVELTPYDLYRGKIEIVGQGISGEYSLNMYVSSVANGESSLSEMLYALRAFCYEAYVYSIGGVVPPYVEHTPTVDVDHRL